MEQLLWWAVGEVARGGRRGVHAGVQQREKEAAVGGTDDAWGGAGQLGGEANRRRPNGGENQWRRRRPCF